GLLAAFGVGIIVALSMPVTDAQVRGAVTGAAGTASSVAGGSTVDGGTTPGGGVAGISVASHVTMAAFPWRWVAVAGAVLIVAAGLLAAWRGTRWPVMSSRYDRPARHRPSPSTDPAALWEALSQGIDPTVSARGDHPPESPVRHSAASGKAGQLPAERAEPGYSDVHVRESPGQPG
ncbi:MAG TPA: Trp biosynthesis-associated membrane protein, partial [Streptosporangiaceae bacterium]